MVSAKDPTRYNVGKLRAYWTARLTAGPLPCSKCGRPVTTAMRWHVDHVVPRAMGGASNDVNNTWPAHGRCNESAGQALAQSRMRARRDQSDGIRTW